MSKSMKVYTEVRVPAIEEFLAKYAEQVRKYYNNCRALYLNKVNEHEAKFHGERGYSKERQESYRKYQKECVDALGVVMFRFVSDGHQFDERVQKELDLLVKNRREVLIYKVTDKIGKIVDASFLSIGDNGELNGIITGENGKVRVETISAGGYNIQCFHFRVLVHLIKERA